jgi:hypothetical protein
LIMRRNGYISMIWELVQNPRQDRPLRQPGRNNLPVWRCKPGDRYEPGFFNPLEQKGHQFFGPKIFKR